MIVYPAGRNDARMEALPQLSTDPADWRRLALRQPPGVARAAAVLLAAMCAYGAGCAYAGALAPWPLFTAVGLALLAIAFAAWMAERYTALTAALTRLATALETDCPHAQDGASALPETGAPATVARLARAINRAARQSAARQAELLHVLAAYAHDQRTPLTRMNLRCELLDDAPLREALLRDLAEMGRLVEASLSCAKLQCSAEEPASRVDADSLLGTLVDDYRDAGRTIELEGRVGCPVVTCPHALRRVLMNLIDNALRYGTDVRLCVRVEARRLVLAVVDSGPGIAHAQMEAVFAPWYRAPETAAQVCGSGLGLSIARRLTQAMRGELHLENRRSGGLEARLTLPLAA
jgi:signal transduction histidine kinase